MIQLHSDCLVFDTAYGMIPCAVEQVAIELVGDNTAAIDPDVIRNAARGVLQFFRDELGKECVTIAEFSEALCRVLRGFGFEVGMEMPNETPEGVVESDLSCLARESGQGFELAFFLRLRQEVTGQLSAKPRMVRFTGLRTCVKLLVGTRRWTPRCQVLSDRIVEYVRECATAAKPDGEVALVVQ
jgi:hypothetical protein